MRVPAIIEVKNHLDELKKNGAIKAWELPYENLLTRLSAAIFFIEPVENADAMPGVWNELTKYDNFSYRINEEKKLSQMLFRVTFSQEEKSKNMEKAMTGVPANA
ncbi:MAG: hypothetical protein ACOYXT_30450 [Bacteroidota bacterium]